MEHLQELDLSDNQLNSLPKPTPPESTCLPSLGTISLERNQLTGRFPQWLVERTEEKLTLLSVAHNSFNGPTTDEQQSDALARLILSCRGTRDARIAAATCSGIPPAGCEAFGPERWELDFDEPMCVKVWLIATEAEPCPPPKFDM